MIRKCLVVPYFGEYPPWMHHWYENTERMREHGYEFLFDENEDEFRERVREILGVDAPDMWGGGNVWDFRPALGALYEEELKDFEWWGHTDFDCVYGRVENWMTDEFLDGLDLYGNHHDYVSGPWSLYRNTEKVNWLFRETEEWRERMASETPSGWAEMGFTDIVNAVHDRGEIRRHFECFQTRDWNSFNSLTLKTDGRLMEGGNEVMLCHFRRTKIYPEGCIL